MKLINNPDLFKYNTSGGNIHRRFHGEYWFWGWCAKRAFTRLITLMRKIRS